jgi:hypothetical protein
MQAFILAIMQFTSAWITGGAPGGTEEPSAAVRTCIATHAPKVEQTIESLTEGADFLVQRVCVGAITEQATETARKASQAQKDRQDAACEEARKEAAAQSSGQSGQASGQTAMALRRMNTTMLEMCDPAARAMYDTSEMSAYMYLQQAGSAPKAMSLAAQTLLDLRSAKTKRR